jgi:hypothetical protein
MTTTTSGGLFVLRTADGEVVLSVDQVRRLTMDRVALDCSRQVRRETSRKRLVFQFAEPGVQRELVLVYFTPGLRWIPTYRLDLEPGGDAEGVAEVSLQAELINELEDLAQVPFDLVVGVPSFRFRDVPSPLVLERTLRQALQQAAPHLMGQQLSNAMFTQRRSEWHAPSAGSTGPEDNPVELPGELTTEQAQDLFVYGVPELTLLRGHRAAVPLLTIRVPYRDVYTWQVVPGAGQPLPPGAVGASPLQLSQNRVWHQIELDNVTDVPWTTGAVLLMEGHRPLAQELLTYTPPGSRVRVPVTVAVGLHGTTTEEETGRTSEALRWAGWTYARVDSRVSLGLTNGRRSPVVVEISCELGGRAEGASDGGSITIGPHRPADGEGWQGYGVVNPHSTVAWVVEMNPGETVRRTAEVQRFLRH